MSTPAKLLTLHAALFLGGFLLLCLPGASTGAAGWWEHLFTAFSAASTTGLSITDIGTSYTTFGQLIILLLVQISGIGYMTLGTVLMLYAHHRFSKEERSLVRNDLGLPDGYGITHIVKAKVVITLVCQTLGFLAFYWLLRDEPGVPAVWDAVFYSVSSFNTAGMSLLPVSETVLADSTAFKAVVLLLSFIGSLGFIVFADLYRSSLNRNRQLSITSKVILSTLALLLAIGVSLYALSLNGTSWSAALSEGFYNCAMALTTGGYSVKPLGGLPVATLFLLSGLMLVGGSPTGTAGGLKLTTLRLVMVKIVAGFRQRESVTLFGSNILRKRVSLAVSSFGSFLGCLAVSIFIILISEPGEPMHLIFEAASAIGNVGLTSGALADFSITGQSVLIILMFIGRVTPLTLGVLMFRPGGAEEATGKSSDLSI